MKKRFFLAFGTVFLFLFASNSFSSLTSETFLPKNQIQNNFLGEKQIEMLAKNRRPVREKWLDAARWMAGEDEEAKVLCRLLDSSFLVIPSERQKGLIVADHNASGIGILPLIKEDSENPFWQEEFRIMSITQFSDDPIPFIILNDHYEPTRVMKGLALLQECYLTLHGEDIDLDLVQVKSFDMIFRLLSKRFGRKYESLVDSNNSNKKISYGDLEKIYGPTPSAFERSAQFSLLWLNTIFKLLEKSSPDSQKAKIDFMKIQERFKFER
ncbi:MAG: hypothetical protein ABIF89_02510 [bacterium]